MDSFCIQDVEGRCAMSILTRIETGYLIDVYNWSKFESNRLNRGCHTYSIETFHHLFPQ